MQGACAAQEGGNVERPVHPSHPETQVIFCVCKFIFRKNEVHLIYCLYTHVHDSFFLILHTGFEISW